MPEGTGYGSKLWRKNKPDAKGYKSLEYG